MAAHKRGGNFIFESPVSRGANSRFAMEGKTEHVDMSTHNDMIKLTSATNAGRIFFDQCAFGASSPKTTQFIASGEALSRLTPLFSKIFCNHPPGTHNSIVGKSENGAAYRTRAAQSYPTDMNAALAKALFALFPATAALRDARGLAEIANLVACATLRQCTG
eukprot:6180759-Pleurochrysis_carterae.AAC.2